MDAHDLMRQLQAVLKTYVRTGELTFKLQDGKVISFETRTYARLLPRDAVDKRDAMRAE